MVDPSFLTILISLRSTLLAVSGSITLNTEFTANSENNSLYELTTFELNDVLTHSIKAYLSVILTGIASCYLMTFKENSRACWNPSETMLGWIPLSSKDSAAFSKAPAKTTTEVVPSPASTSWAFEISTSFR